MNSLDWLDPAVLRRMSFVIEMRVPPARVRRRVWHRQLASQRFEHAEAEARRLADEIPLSSGVISTAIRTAKLTGGDPATLRRVAAALAQAVRQGRPLPPTGGQAVPFDAALLNADCDLTQLLDRLSAAGAPLDFSLCLYGPTGTGKTAFVRRLAADLGLDPLQKRASDLLSKWLGESEQKIAAAFAEARAQRQFLIIDEADSLLRDRETAVRSWEVSQVNELLTWMECHDLPFACTTNLMDQLDKASLRRFTFKIKLDYLKPAQAAAAFRRYFGLRPPAALAGLHILTPGDFAVVAKKLRFMAEARDDPASVVTLLARECAAKRPESRPIGFNPVGRPREMG